MDKDETWFVVFTAMIAIFVSLAVVFLVKSKDDDMKQKARECIAVGGTPIISGGLVGDFIGCAGEDEG